MFRIELGSTNAEIKDRMFFSSVYARDMWFLVWAVSDLLQEGIQFSTFSLSANAVLRDSHSRTLAERTQKIGMALDQILRSTTSCSLAVCCVSREGLMEFVTYGPFEVKRISLDEERVFGSQEFLKNYTTQWMVGPEGLNLGAKLDFFEKHPGNSFDADTVSVAPEILLENGERIVISHPELPEECVVELKFDPMLFPIKQHDPEQDEVVDNRGEKFWWIREEQTAPTVEELPEPSQTPTPIEKAVRPVRDVLDGPWGLYIWVALIILGALYRIFKS